MHLYSERNDITGKVFCYFKKINLLRKLVSMKAMIRESEIFGMFVLLWYSLLALFNCHDKLGKTAPLL